MLESASLTMPGREKHVSSTAKKRFFNVISYFKQQSQKSKAKGPMTLMHKTTKATGYCNFIYAVSERCVE